MVACHELDQTSEFHWRVSARSNFENICAMGSGLRAFAAKIRALGVNLKLWNEIIRRIFFAFVVREQGFAAHETERNSTSI